jgi:hypothetical protein
VREREREEIGMGGASEGPLGAVKVWKFVERVQLKKTDFDYEAICCKTKPYRG